MWLYVQKARDSGCSPSSLLFDTELLWGVASALSVLLKELLTFLFQE